MKTLKEKDKQSFLARKEEVYSLIMEMGSLLADYDHQWSNELRRKFERATSFLSYKEYYCGTCGAKDGAEHPKTGYCFHCDTDNWIPKND